VRALASITFVYDAKQDRVVAAINPGRAEAWSCWLTRRLVLALLERAAEFVASTSTLARRAPSSFRSEFAAFEREAAIATTAKAMSKTPDEVLKSSANAAELAAGVTIQNQGDKFRLELRGESGDGAEAALTRAEIVRILQMLQSVVAKAGWLAAPAQSQTPPNRDVTKPKPFRN
jgi:hypothetical protein